VLTASHCVSGTPASHLGIFVGQDHNHPATTDRFIAAREVHYESAPDGSLATDVAVLVLADRVDGATLPWNKTDLPPSLVGSEVRFVGYGRIGPSPDAPYGRRRFGTLTIDGIDGNIVSLKASGDGTVCHGDSGGPLLLNRDGREVIIAVATASDCQSKNVGSRIDGQSRWIQSYLDSNP
jgi:hypothetical protein